MGIDFNPVSDNPRSRCRGVSISSSSHAIDVLSGCSGREERTLHHAYVTGWRMKARICGRFFSGLDVLGKGCARVRRYAAPSLPCLLLVHRCELLASRRSDCATLQTRGRLYRNQMDDLFSAVTPFSVILTHVMRDLRVHRQRCYRCIITHHQIPICVIPPSLSLFLSLSRRMKFNNLHAVTSDASSLNSSRRRCSRHFFHARIWPKILHNRIVEVATEFFMR